MVSVRGLFLPVSSLLLFYGGERKVVLSSYVLNSPQSEKKAVLRSPES